MKNSASALCAFIALTIAFCSASALALINPKFTPVILVHQSALIVQLQMNPAKDGKITADVKSVLSGKLDAKTITFDLTKTSFKDHATTVAQFAASPDTSLAILFVGGFTENPDAAAADAPQGAAPPQKALLNVGGTWVTFTSGDAGSWDMDKIDTDAMGPTWNGATDMLLRAVQYIVAEPDADVPVKEGVSWASFNQFAQIDGVVHAAMSVDLLGDGQLSLYITSEGGDHLFKYDTKASALTDVTAAVKLAVKSKVATWLDADGDGRMDLLSWDGHALTLYTQQPDGTFKAGDPLLADALKEGCFSLNAIDLGKPGHPGVIIGSKISTLLWNSEKPNAIEPIGPPYNGPGPGAPNATLVADFDGDGIPDIVRIFEGTSLVFKGKAPGQFEDPKSCNISTGPGPGSAFVGDFEGAGALDIFTVSAGGATHLWSNRGKFQFVESISGTGELSYKATSGAVGGMVGDFNNDGRQDILFYYAAEAPHLFFNRGFRSFGMANGMDVAGHNMMPNADQGQQAGCLADLNGDGAQDMVIIQKDGSAFVFFTDPGDVSARCVRGVLSSKSPNIGPITVTGYKGTRCLGAWNVSAGTSEAIVAIPDAGEVKLKWQFPGQAPQEKKFTIENKPVRAVLNEQK